MAADFCTDSELALTPEHDAHIAAASPAENQGDDKMLVVDGSNVVRTLVGFDPDAIDGFMASGNFQSATLELVPAQAEPTGGMPDLIDAHPLEKPFVEGQGEVEDHEPVGDSIAPSPLSGAQYLEASAAAPSALRGRTRRVARRVGGRETAPGVTWNCAVDANTANEHPGDCHVHWDDDGGDHGLPTADPVAIGAPGAVMAWDVTDDVLAGVSGWLIRKRDESDPSGVAFHSSEGAEVLGAPHLAPRLILR